MVWDIVGKLLLKFLAQLSPQALMLLGACVVTGGCSVFFYKRWTKYQCHKVWRAVANVTGLTKVGPDKPAYDDPLLMHGEFEGYKLIVQEENVNIGENVSVATTIKFVISNPADYFVRVRRKMKFVDALGRSFISKIVPIDDPLFMKRFLIKTNNVDFVRVILTQDIRQAILNNLPDIDLSLEENCLMHSIEGVENNGEKIIAAITVLANLCKKIDGTESVDGLDEFEL